jgi:hypothetical protein
MLMMLVHVETNHDVVANDKRSFRDAFFAIQSKMYVCAAAMKKPC